MTQCLGQRLVAAHFVLEELVVDSIARVQHTRMVGTEVLANHKDQLGLFHVLQRDGALENTDGRQKCDTLRFVAHTRTVRQVIGAHAARDELVHKRRFIRCTLESVKGASIRLRRLDVLADRC